MRTSLRCLLTLALPLVALLVACNGGGTSPPTGEAGTATASPTPTPEPPHAADLEIPPGITERYRDVTEITLDAGSSYGFDNLALAAKRGVQGLPCPAFVFLFSWQVRQPYPPEDVDIHFQTVSMDKAAELASGASGSANVGCSYVQVVNNGALQVTLEMRYGFGERQR